ncbi:MAG: alpha/beta hydrolase [Actinobacteria bacterium]|nr:alpha/beta hydrolase [Actinomycetota bacterium]
MLLITVVFVGAPEHIITGVALLAFAGGWAALAELSARRTDQPQRWARVPAAVMAAAGFLILLVAPTGNQAGWIWPPAIAALAAWMAVQARHSLHSHARAWVLYPVFAALLLSAVGGAYETYREANDQTVGAVPGRLVDVGGYKLHINCTGTGGPTVVLEPGLGEVSPMMSAWIAPDVASTTRVCVYDRAGRGWSQSSGAPQNAEQVATDLHTLLRNAGETGPFVLAGHSAGGIYVLNFVKLFPNDVAGAVLLDSMSPQQYQRIPSWQGFYEAFRRASSVMPTLARLGVGRVVYDSQFGDLPQPQRDQERAFVATPRHNRSVRDEFSQIRTSLNQAAEIQTLGSLPLEVLTAGHQDYDQWFPLQDELLSLSSNSVHRTIADATHDMLLADRDTARKSSDAILDVVTAVRTGSPVKGG